MRHTVLAVAAAAVAATISVPVSTHAPASTTHTTPEATATSTQPGDGPSDQQRTTSTTSSTGTAETSGSHGAVAVERPAATGTHPPGERRYRAEQRHQAEREAQWHPDDQRHLDEQRQQHHEGPTSPEGFQVAGGSSRAGEGSRVTFTVELDGAVDEDLSEVVELVEVALYDPRSWVQDHTLERIDDPAAADIRVVLGAPATVDGLCAQARLDTNGLFSCWNGRVAALNAMRWADGAWGFGDDLMGYRTYLVNHEFGHGLGYGHLGCAAAGRLAPVMMQQTKDTAGCEPNGWPYPDA